MRSKKKTQKFSRIFFGTILKQFFKNGVFVILSKFDDISRATRIFKQKTDSGFFFRASKHTNPENFIPIGQRQH
jgi:hypothetical protein